jgi:SET domain-containing protein
MTKTYRPLPSFLTIKDSEIEGLGLFATEEIYEDICLGTTHIFDIRFEDNLIRTPLGGFINHSDTPNCIIRREEEGSSVMEKGFPIRNYLYSLRDIKPGEELTVTYTTYKV